MKFFKNVKTSPGNIAIQSCCKSTYIKFCPKYFCNILNLVSQVTLHWRLAFPFSVVSILKSLEGGKWDDKLKHLLEICIFTYFYPLELKSNLFTTGECEHFKKGIEVRGPPVSPTSSLCTWERAEPVKIRELP